MADQFFFVLEVQPAGRRAAGNDQRLGLDPFVVGFDPNVIVARLEVGDFGVGKSGAEVLRLFMHVQNELRSVDPFRKSGKIFHQRSGGKLAAGLAAFQNERIQIRASGINGSRQSGAATANDDHLFHISI